MFVKKLDYETAFADRPGEGEFTFLIRWEIFVAEGTCRLVTTGPLYCNMQLSPLIIGNWGGFTIGAPWSRAKKFSTPCNGLAAI